ncbi:AAA family ATPase [Serratia sp. NA_112.1]|uniref:AAA family ATPase n=1 Tax=unclassified Serratia (in: enterobacteria) TaxID=2647522 RepID=UPI004046D855
MNFNFAIPIENSQMSFTLENGNSIIFVGANGGGKTRLAVKIENELGLSAHRISAHRALSLNPSVAKISERQALSGLRTGYADESSGVQYRDGRRWGGKQAVNLLNDFDYLIQALFADQANTSLIAYNKYKPGGQGAASDFKLTKLDRLNDIWSRLLPHRVLHISGDDILVSLPGQETMYKASEMSDGERAIFYMIGQVLVADDNQVLIIDEPELHVHRSIMSKLWDELEAARSDCAFVFITHELEFAAARTAQKYVIRDYNPAPFWSIEAVPEDTGFGEELTTLILGSRKPILFVEGSNSSLDLAIYRSCYPEWTVIPRSSCSEVIYSVVTLRHNAMFTRITCSGIVDADDYDEDDKTYLETLGITTLSVSEVENLILLPDVSRAIAVSEGYADDELSTRLSNLSEAIFNSVSVPEAIELVVAQYCRRRIDRALKKIDLSRARTISEIESEYAEKTNDLNIREMADGLMGKIQLAIETKDLPMLLAHYDNKGFVSLAATHLKSCQKRNFEAWLLRVLRNKTNPGVTAAISGYLPVI